MKNTLSDLNNHMFAQIDRLADEDLDEVGLEREIKRTQAMEKIARSIIDNGSLALEAKRFVDDYRTGDAVAIPLLGIKGDTQ